MARWRPMPIQFWWATIITFLVFIFLLKLNGFYILLLWIFLFTFTIFSLLLKCKKVCFWLSFSPFFYQFIFLRKVFFTFGVFFFRCLLSHCITLMMMMMKNGKLQTTSFKLKSISHAIFIFIISIFFSIISAVKLS